MYFQFINETTFNAWIFESYISFHPLFFFLFLFFHSLTFTESHKLHQIWLDSHVDHSNWIVNNHRTNWIRITNKYFEFYSTLHFLASTGEKCRIWNGYDLSYWVDRVLENRVSLNDFYSKAIPISIVQPSKICIIVNTTLAASHWRYAIEKSSQRQSNVEVY